MTKPKMTFHESYGGHIAVKTLRLVKKFNVSPADLDLMLDLLNTREWTDVDAHIIANSQQGYYVGETF